MLRMVWARILLYRSREEKSSSFPNNHQIIHQTPLRKKTISASFWGLFHQSTALITTRREYFIYLEKTLVMSAVFVKMWQIGNASILSFGSATIVISTALCPFPAFILCEKTSTVR